jgi:hypothetical protein
VRRTSQKTGGAPHFVRCGALAALSGTLPRPPSNTTFNGVKIIFDAVKINLNGVKIKKDGV